MPRQYVPSHRPALSRAIRVGPHVLVTGTAPIDEDGNTVGVGDVEAQTRRCIEIIEQALVEVGAALTDVVRTRLLLANIDDWETVARVTEEAFGVARPVGILYEVSRFINPEWMVEIEVDAIIDHD